MRWIMVGIIVGSTVLADLLQSFEMKRNVVAVDDLRPGRIGRLLGEFARRGPLILAVCFMAISFFAFMMVLQLIWVKTMVPETKGVPLEQMQKRLGIL